MARPALLVPDRVQRVRRPPSLKAPGCSCCPRCVRSKCFLVPPAAFVLLQLLFVAYISQEVRRPAARGEETEFNATTPPTLQPAAAAEPPHHDELVPEAPPQQAESRAGLHGLERRSEAADAPEDGADGTPQGRDEHGGRRRRRRRVGIVRRRTNFTHELQWDFAPTSVAEEQITLVGCLGRGTYGVVLNVSYPGGAAALKVPLMRTWGFKFYRVELEALLALRGGGEGERHLVRLLGNATLPTARLLALNTSEAAWECVNRTDLLLRPEVSALPALLLEPFPRGTLFHALASLAAPDAVAEMTGAKLTHVSLDGQKRYFKQRLQAARAPGAPYREAVAGAWDVLVGLARGMRRLHGRRLIHRDLTEPGKNVMIKRDARGLTSALVDLSQAERCGEGRGAGARAIEAYAFGNVLYFACYGRVRHTVAWTKYSCDLPRQGLLELQQQHAADQPAGPADAEAHFNRCTSALQPQLDALMRYCWQPTLDAADALLRPAQRDGHSNHSWDVVIEQLQAMRTRKKPLFRFM